MYSENTVIKLNAIAHKYKDLIHRSIHAVLSQPPYKNTGAGAASVTVDVIDGDQAKAPQIVTKFDDHLNYINNRKMEWTKLPDMKELLTWAKTKKTTDAEAEQLAWATAWDKKKNDTWKAKPWRKKTLSAVLKEMNELIVAEMDQAIEEDFQKAAKV